MCDAFRVRVVDTLQNLADDFWSLLLGKGILLHDLREQLPPLKKLSH